MGGTLNLKFAKGEIAKVKQVFYKVSPDATNLFAPDCPELPEDSKLRGLYVEFKRNIMSLDYAIWDKYSSAWGTIFGQELGRHFQIEKAGWDSVGWCKDMAEFNSCSGLVIPGKGLIKDNLFTLAYYGLTLDKTKTLQKNFLH